MSKAKAPKAGAKPSRSLKSTEKSGVKSKTASWVKCVECSKKIEAQEQALFVEEEVGRFFCSEPCIVTYFTPEIEKLERTYGRVVSSKELTAEERERFAHFRWMVVEKPDEIWKETMPSGDSRYTLISQYHPENRTVFGVAVCLMLRGEPSFLFLAFVTQEKELVDEFRRGQPIQVARIDSRLESTETSSNDNVISMDSARDRLAEAWTEADSIRARLLEKRSLQDIPQEDFGFYQNCLEETLQTPNELWSYTPQGQKKVYHFLKRYDQDESFWYVVIAKDTVDETQIEIVDAFPTRDPKLLSLCQHGEKESIQTTLDPTANEGVPVRRQVH